MRLIPWIFILCLTISDNLCSQIIRGDTTQKRIALVFTGDEFGDGGEFIRSALKKIILRLHFFLQAIFTGILFLKILFSD